MMQESLTRRAKIETLHAAALQARDTQLIQEISKELELFDNSLALTAAMLNQLHDEN